MIELLAVKAGQKYCRFQENSFELCGMSKASVYPLQELERVKERLNMVEKVHPDAMIIKMKITEEVLMGEDDETGLK